jgi:nitroimidazol reductase NimA-like FMN-containing flavoprotein (pyridoxamine 5'-phosphate oxidase superfamily)
MRRADREISGRSEIEDIILKADVCRIAIANDNYPYIVTMNFGYKPDPKPSIYFHCAREGKKLEMIAVNNHICFEMDTDHEIYNGKKGCDWGMKFSSVLGYGNIYIVAEKSEKTDGLNCIMKHYGGEGELLYDEKVFENTLVLRLDILEMTAKRK